MNKWHNKLSVFLIVTIFISFFAIISLDNETVNANPNAWRSAWWQQAATSISQMIILNLLSAPPSNSFLPFNLLIDVLGFNHPLANELIVENFVVKFNLIQSVLFIGSGVLISVMTTLISCILIFKIASRDILSDSRII